jgi:hypothetical protein
MRLFDTLSRTERDLRPIDGATFRFYCCGPTVYGPAHIGNFRTFVLQDVLRRVLETGGMRTLHVRNITDVDDKTIRDSQKAGQTLAEFTAGWTEKFHHDCEKLALLEPHIEPGAGPAVSHSARSDVDLAMSGDLDPLRAESIAAELEELSVPCHFDVQALDPIEYHPLREHIQRVGILIYPES